MKADLIYKCSQCGGTEYVGNIECQDPIEYGPRMLAILQDTIWHQCWKDEPQITTKYYGICRLVGIREIPEPKEKTDGKV